MYTFDAMFAYFRVWPRLLLISLRSFADYFSMVSVHFVAIIVLFMIKKKLLNKYTYNVYTPTTGRWRNDQKWASSCVYKRETNKNCFNFAFIYDDCVRIWYGNKMKTQNNVFAWNSRWSHSKNSGSNKSFIHPFILAAIATTSELNKWWKPYERCWKRCSVDWEFKPVARKEVNEEK